MNGYMNVILCDHTEREHLLPLTFTRPVGKIRIGIFTIDEKWRNYSGAQVSFKTQPYLQDLFPQTTTDNNFFVNGALLPTSNIIDEIFALQNEQSLFKGEQWLATRSSHADFTQDSGNRKEFTSECHILNRPWLIFQLNAWALQQDFDWITSHRISAPVPNYVTLIGENIFIEPDAVIMPSIINATTGPVYIGQHAEIMEGSMVRGSLALLDHAQLKMGAKVYGATTIGPHSRVGGEVNNAVIFGYSNKGHDGFIGNTVVGEWCNLGADTNTSNLKNNYADVKIHSYALNRSESTGGQFCGLIMGDHAKCGINTMFNTGTVCGIFANVFDSGFPHRRIPDFGWGGASGFKVFRYDDAMEVAERVMERRNVQLTDDWRAVYLYLFQQLTKS